MTNFGVRLACALLLVAAGEVAAAKALLDVNATGPCKVAYENSCKKLISPGPGKGAVCLNSLQGKLDSPLPTACVDEIHSVLGFLAQHPMMFFEKACAKEQAELCPGRSGAETFVCLKNVLHPKKKNKEAGKTAPSLGGACKEKVFLLEVFQAQAMELDDPFFAACKSDLSLIDPCNKIPAYSPQAGKKVCLMKHKKQLSSTCSQLLFKRLQEHLSDVRLMPVVFRSCQGLIKQECGGIEYGEARVLKCLWAQQSKAAHDCKTQIHEVTKNKLSDYRLDYRIRTRCSTDIKKLCQKEQWRVDNLTASELFGSEWQEGKSGLVLQCLKANYTKISSADCKPEIQRLVRAQAETPDLDPVFTRACKGDIDLYCNKTKPERIHWCLRNHLKKLMPKCRQLEIVQGSISAVDVSMKPAITSACGPAIKKFCGDVGKGDAQVIQCLQDHMEDEGMGRKCIQVVGEDLEASNHDWRLKFGIHQACMVDAGRLCHTELPKAAGSVLACLKANRTKIAHAPCKAEVFRYTQQTLKNIKYAPDTFAACVQDVNTLCTNVQPGQGRVHDCLVKHKNSLSFECAATEFREQEHMAEDIRLHPKAKALCMSSAKALCPDIPFGEGRVWTCLSSKKDNAKLAAGCRAIVTSHERLQNYEFGLNPQLKKYCSKEAVRLCPFQATMSDLKEFGSEGETIGCLIAHRSEVKSQDCKAALLTKQVQRLANIDNSPDAKDYCSLDIDKFCKDVQSGNGGQVHKCLQSHMKELSGDCRMVELDLMQMAMEDARLLPAMKKECAAAQKRYCKDVQPGGGLLIICMLKHMHDTTMEPGCKHKLEVVQKVRATSIRFNPILAKQCKDDLALLQGSHGKEARCKKQDDQDVALTGVAINCLTEHVAEVKKSGCKMALLNVMQMQSSDVRAKPGMQNACEHDIKALCQGIEAGKGRIQACLRKNVKRITHQGCKAMVNKVWKAEKKDAVLNPQVRRRCQNELQAFCPQVERGEARKLVCLKQHAKLSGFSEGCRNTLIKLNATLPASAAATSVQDLLNTRSFWDKWGGMLMGGIAVLLTIWIVALGFLIRWLRSRKSFYGVQVDQPEVYGVPEGKVEDRA